MGYIESFNARLRGEAHNAETFYTLREGQIIIESRHNAATTPFYPMRRSETIYRREVFVPAFTPWPAPQYRQAPPATLAQPAAPN